MEVFALALDVKTAVYTQERPLTVPLFSYLCVQSCLGAKRRPKVSQAAWLQEWRHLKQEVKH